jgi:hypothetical protein
MTGSQSIQRLVNVKKINKLLKTFKAPEISLGFFIFPAASLLGCQAGTTYTNVYIRYIQKMASPFGPAIQPFQVISQRHANYYLYPDVWNCFQVKPEAQLLLDLQLTLECELRWSFRKPLALT